MHEIKEKMNRDYLRKKIGCVSKKTDVYLSSDKLKLVGLIDEVLFFEDNSAAPLDYKFAEYNDRVYKTLKYQQTCYAMLIEENFHCTVNNAFLCYIRSNNYLKKITISKNNKSQGGLNKLWRRKKFLKKRLNS
ncbi:MAG: hypothetical protein U9O98_04860, partial [Asgard group archaeon]|nr:hypothetical protein [Asgard group archaeon]